MQNILFISLLVIFFFLNLIFKKNKFFPNYSGDIHQTLTGEKNIPLSGGIFILLFVLILIVEVYNYFAVLIFLIFLLGFFSDIKLLSSPKIRFIIQIILQDNRRANLID